MAYELNASCPNTSAGGVEFGADPGALAALVTSCRARTDRPLIVKLSPAFPNPGELSTAAAAAGADGFTCINTMPGMMWREPSGNGGGRDLESRLGRGEGGVSGPALLAVGVAMTRKVSEATGKPVVGVGGIRTAEDALQYLSAGASLVGIGTAALADPRVPTRVARGLERVRGG